jgi:hypothetical protein
MGATRNVHTTLGETFCKVSIFKGSEGYGKNIWNGFSEISCENVNWHKNYIKQRFARPISVLRASMLV